MLLEERSRTGVCARGLCLCRRGFPKQEAAATILRTMKLYLDATPQSTLKEVHFVLFDPESVRVYVTELGRLDIEATAH